MKNTGNYKELLKTFRLNIYELKNRIIFAPMSTQLANTDGSVSERMVAYYAEKASGGPGMIITETFHIDNHASRFTYVQPSIYHDRFIPGLSNLADYIKRGGALAIAQIGHAGRQTTFEINNCEPVAPSRIENGPTEHCHELTGKEIREIISNFAEASFRAKTAGFNGVEIHGGNGYLINEFLSPYTNRRKDDYGKNKILFLLQIIEAVHEAVGNNFITGVRLGFSDYVPGGLDSYDAIKTYASIPEQLVSYLHTSAGTAESDDYRIQPIYHNHAILRDVSRELKKVTKIPVVLTGSINSPNLAEDILKKKDADLIGMGRQLLADPKLPNKIADHGMNNVCPCIRCNQGCLNRVREGKTIKCSVNPHTGYENLNYYYLRVNNNKERNRVLIAGAGPAGITAALRASELGFQVKILEKESKLGGLLNTAQFEDFKQDIRDYLEYLKKIIVKSEVKIFRSVKVDRVILEEQYPDIFINATGSLPFMPSLPKNIPYEVVDIRKVLMTLDEYLDKNNIVIIGGGSAGCELACTLSLYKKQVTIIEQAPDILLDIDPVSALGLRRLIDKRDLTIHVNTKFTQLDPNGVVTSKENVTIYGDLVIFAAGSLPNGEIDQIIDSKRYRLGYNYLRIGDARKVGNLYDAVNTSYWDISSLLLRYLQLA